MTLLLTLLISAVVIIIGIVILFLIFAFLSQKFGNKVATIVVIILFFLPTIYKFVSYESSSNIDTRTWADKPRSEWTNKDKQDYVEWTLEEGHKEWENKKIGE